MDLLEIWQRALTEKVKPRSGPGHEQKLLARELFAEYERRRVSDEGATTRWTENPGSHIRQWVDIGVKSREFWNVASGCVLMGADREMVVLDALRRGIKHAVQKDISRRFRDGR